MKRDRNGIVDPRPTAGLTFNTDATIRGVEVEANSLAGDFWKWGGSLSYVDAKYDDGAVAPCNQFDSSGSLMIAAGLRVAICDVSQQHISEEPNWSASLNAEYARPLNHLEWFIPGLYKFNGHRINEDLGRTSAYSTLNLYSGIRSEDGRWEASLWGKNLLDKEARSGLFPPEITPDTQSYTLAKIIPERSFGSTLVYRFGGF